MGTAAETYDSIPRTSDTIPAPTGPIPAPEEKSAEPASAIPDAEVNAGYRMAPGAATSGRLRELPLAEVTTDASPLVAVDLAI